MSITRRGFLEGAGLTAAAGAFAAVRPVHAAATRGPEIPSNIIMLVADGMSAGTLTCSDHLSHLVRKKGLTWMNLYRQEGTHFGYMDMRSLDSWVTDSSAASSSWGSGSRIRNGAVNALPDGRELTPLYTVLKEAGWKRGLVTTTEITHATPAGFACNDRSRGSADKFAEQYLEREVDVLLGGGFKYFNPSKRKDKKDLPAAYAKAGYTVVQNRKALAGAADKGRLLGLFADSHLPFTVDHRNDDSLQAEVPTLAEMTSAALKRLSGEGRFILQVEGGRVDHGCHSCDAAGAFYDMLAFDEALDVCLEFQKQNPDTLLVITTDHGNGNPGLNGSGGNYVASNALFTNLRETRGSFASILSAIGKAGSQEGVVQVLKDYTGYDCPGSKADQLLRTMSKQGEDLYSAMNNTVYHLGQILANHWAVGWSGNVHTSDFVPIVATGPGSSHFHGFIQNTQVFERFMDFAGLEFRNPSVPLISAGAAPGELEDQRSYLNA